MWRKRKVGRNQRDEPSEPAITDGSDAGTTQTAVNHCIDALEELGVIAAS